jgi:hypothetical protein
VEGPQVEEQIEALAGAEVDLVHLHRRREQAPVVADDGERGAIAARQPEHPSVRALHHTEPVQGVVDPVLGCTRAVDERLGAHEPRRLRLVGEVAGPVEERISDHQRDLPPPVGQAQRRLLRVADEDAAGQPQGDLFGRHQVRMRVVEVQRRALSEREVVRVGATGRDRLVRLTVGRSGHHEPVPVDRARRGQAVRERNAHDVAAVRDERRAGHGPVVGVGQAGPAPEVDGGAARLECSTDRRHGGRQEQRVPCRVGRAGRRHRLAGRKDERPQPASGEEPCRTRGHADEPPT